MQWNRVLWNQTFPSLLSTTGGALDTNLNLSELLIGPDFSHRITFEWNLYQWVEVPGNSQGDEQPVD